MVNMRKILGSFACFLALSGQVNIDLNAQTTQYIEHKKRININKEEYAKLCENIQKINLLYFIVHNDVGFDKETLQSIMPILKKTLKESKKRMQNGSVEDAKVYYSTFALQSFFKSKEIVGSIEILRDFDIVEYGKGVQMAQNDLRVFNV